jgi:hypothetical protein
VKGWLLDTIVIAEVSGAKPDPRVRKWISAPDESTFFLSVLNRLRTALEARFRGRVLPLSDATVRRCGVINGETKRVTKHSPSVIDTMLAATAIEHWLYFVMPNTHDVIRSGATLFNPWGDDPSAFPIL